MAGPASDRGGLHRRLVGAATILCLLILWHLLTIVMRGRVPRLSG